MTASLPIPCIISYHWDKNLILDQFKAPSTYTFLTLFNLEAPENEDWIKTKLIEKLIYQLPVFIDETDCTTYIHIKRHAKKTLKSATDFFENGQYIDSLET